MPLPAGTSKDQATLITDTDSVVKDNGGSNVAKTRGSTFRQLLADYLASFWTRKDTYVAERNTATLTFDQEAIYLGVGGAGISSSTITLSLANAKSGTVARFYSQTSGSAPTIDFGTFNVAVNQELQAYDSGSGKVNVYTFLAIKKGSVWIVEYSRYVANVTAL